MWLKRFCLFGLVLAVAGCSDDDSQEAQVLLEPGMVFVEAGEAVIGSNKIDESGIAKEFGFVRDLYLNEHPEHKVLLKAFQIDKYEVTNQEYKQFVIEAEYQEPVLWVQNGYNVRWEILEGFGVDRLRQVANDYFQLDADVSLLSKTFNSKLPQKGQIASPLSSKINFDNLCLQTGH